MPSERTIGPGQTRLTVVDNRGNPRRINVYNHKLSRAERHQEVRDRVHRAARSVGENDTPWAISNRAANEALRPTTRRVAHARSADGWWKRSGVSPTSTSDKKATNLKLRRIGPERDRKARRNNMITGGIAGGAAAGSAAFIHGGPRRGLIGAGIGGAAGALAGRVWPRPHHELNYRRPGKVEKFDRGMPVMSLDYSRGANYRSGTAAVGRRMDVVEKAFRPKIPKLRGRKPVPLPRRIDPDGPPPMTDKMVGQHKFEIGDKEGYQADLFRHGPDKANRDWRLSKADAALGVGAVKQVRPTKVAGRRASGLAAKTSKTPTVPAMKPVRDESQPPIHPSLIGKASSWQTIDQRELKARRARRTQRRAEAGISTGAGIASYGYFGYPQSGKRVADTYRNMRDNVKTNYKFNRVVGNSRTKAVGNTVKGSAKQLKHLPKHLGAGGMMLAGGGALAGAGAIGYAQGRIREKHHQKKINERRKAAHVKRRQSALTVTKAANDGRKSWAYDKKSGRWGRVSNTQQWAKGGDRVGVRPLQDKTGRRQQVAAPVVAGAGGATAAIGTSADHLRPKTRGGLIGAGALGVTGGFALKERAASHRGVYVHNETSGKEGMVGNKRFNQKQFQLNKDHELSKRVRNYDAEDRRQRRLAAGATAAGLAGGYLAFRGGQRIVRDTKELRAGARSLKENLGEHKWSRTGGQGGGSKTFELSDQERAALSRAHSRRSVAVPDNQALGLLGGGAALTGVGAGLGNHARSKANRRWYG